MTVLIFFHSVVVLFAISLSMAAYDEYESKSDDWVYVIGTNLALFSMSALLTMSVERYLALKYPFFHHTAVTKRKLVFFLAFLMTSVISVSPLLYFQWESSGKVIIIAFLLFFVFLFVYLNYNIFIIARSKRKFVVGGAMAHSRHISKGWTSNVKNISTCSLAVACFLIFSLPKVVYSVLHSSDTFPNERFTMLIISFWTHTLMAMNSTFNCIIFFWKHSVLRREGVKTIKRCLCVRS
jgi:hypothetical protein